MTPREVVRPGGEDAAGMRFRLRADQCAVRVEGWLVVETREGETDGAVRARVEGARAAHAAQLAAGARRTSIVEDPESPVAPVRTEDGGHSPVDAGEALGTLREALKAVRA